MLIKILCIAMFSAASPFLLAGTPVTSITETELNIQKSLNKFCIECHDEDLNEGNVRLDNFSKLGSEQKEKLVQRIEEQVAFATMPPEKEKKQPAATDRKDWLANIDAWYELQKIKSPLAGKMQTHAYANYVDHEKLFSGKYKHLYPFTYDRGWIISEYIFKEKVNSIINMPPAKAGKQVAGHRGESLPESIANPFKLDSASGVRYYADRALSSSQFESMLGNAPHIAAGMIELARNSGKSRKDQISRQGIEIIKKIIAEDDRLDATLRSREAFLQDFTDHVCQEIYGAQNEALLPPFKPIPLKENRVCKLDEVKPSWAFGGIPGSDGKAIYTMIMTYGKPADHLKFLRQCEKYWRDWGVANSVVERRVETMRKYLTWALAQKRMDKSSSGPLPKYKALDAKEMQVIHATIKKLRKKGMTYNDIVNVCMNEWRSEFQKIRNSIPLNKDDAVKLVKDLHLTLYQRQASQAEIEGCVELLNTYARDISKAEAIQRLIEMLVLRAEFTIRNEKGSGTADAQGRRMLSPRDASYAIAYALTDTIPDSALVKAANEGRLNSKEDYKREILRLLKGGSEKYLVDSSLGSAGRHITDMPIRKLRFFREFFGYDNALDVFKDEKRLHEEIGSTRHRLIMEADMLVEHILKKDKNVFEELLTTDEFFVLHSEDHKKLASINNSKGARGFQNILRYYVKDPKTWKPMTSQPGKVENRMGILTHPAWLQAFSQNTHTDPVTRGKWVREKLLAGTIPDVPIGVEAVIPEDHAKTLRQRLAMVTEKKDCWRCHKLMNPLGNAFEMYDDFGRYREKEDLEHPDNITSKPLGPIKNTHKKGTQLKILRHIISYKTAPMDSSGIVDLTIESQLHGKVKDVHDMLGKMAKSDLVRQSIIRHAFRYFMGRNEMLSDSKTLIEADEAYQKSGGSFDALIVSLLTSDSFIYRKEFKE